MPKYSDVLDTVASLQNDTAKDVYTYAACLPYLNIALRTLQENYQQNNVPVTKELSAVLPVDANISEIGFTGTTPTLPPDLIEIQNLWESERNLNSWIPVSKRYAIPQYMISDAKTSSFLIWAWVDQQIKLLPCNRNNDLKIDYIKTIFPAINTGNLSLEIAAVNSQTYLEFKTAALCSFFIGENETRALAQEDQAVGALDRSLGISTKGKQPIPARRRPFRSAYKARGHNW